MKVTVNRPNLAPDADVEVQGLGVFKNGTTTEIEVEGDDLVIGEPLGKTPVAPQAPAVTIPETPEIKKEGE